MTTVMTASEFADGLNVCIGNYGYYNEGELHDAWITLPKTGEEIEELLEESNLRDDLHEEIYISDYDGKPFDLENVFGELTSLWDLNLLAKQLQDLDDSDIDKITAYCQNIDEPSDVIELMNLIEQVDNIEYYEYNCPEFVDDEYEKFGYSLLEDGSFPELENMFDKYSYFGHCFDMKKFGHEMRHDYTLCENGYIDDILTNIHLDFYTRNELEDTYLLL